MNLPAAAEEMIRKLIECLVMKDYQALADRGWLGRLTIRELSGAVSDYGRQLILPPKDLLQRIDVYELNDGSGWSLDVPVWTAEEGLSDLTLSLDLKAEGDELELGISDLHVL